ncbi:MAG: peptide deformylase [Solirubrobacterales bacterium]|nr:peptide deformylase [Solirubrobacterales bacterium]
MVRHHGAGLAATQVGSLLAMFAYREHPEDDAQVLVNPRVVWASAERRAFVEGCLSFNTVLVEVERPAAVAVAGQNPHGDGIRIEAEGYLASLLQHEIDHLNGVLTLDRATAAERRRVVAALSGQQRHQNLTASETPIRPI